jgi:hypothetical protein
MNLTNFLWVGSTALHNNRRMVIVGIDAPHLILFDGREHIRVHISQVRPEVRTPPVVPGQN